MRLINHYINYNIVMLAMLVTGMFACSPSSKEAKPSNNQTGGIPVSPANLVNTLMGTDSEFSLSNGNTYPAVAVPWGMNFWTAQTAKNGDGWAYKYDDHQINGIKQTHQPSPWINDYGAFSLMAGTGKPQFKQEDRASWFSHKAETAQPHYYQVYLADYDVNLEVTPTARAAHFRFTFPQRDSAYIILDAFKGGSMVKIIPEERKIIGYCRNNHGGVPDNFHNYFELVADKDFEFAHVWKDTTLLANTLKVEAGHVGAAIGFKTKTGEQVHIKVASSFISPEQAALNLAREIGKHTFEQTKEKAFEQWNQELGRIQIKGKSQNDIRTFYSCLYRVLLFPRSFYEYNAEGKIVHYSPYNGQVLPGYMYTDNGFWDTFRAVFPFFNLMYPQLNAKIMEGLTNTYKESGWLPEWASPGHRNAMIGSNSAPIIADAYIKGVRGFDIETLYEAILKNANVADGRPVASVGREGLEYYNKLGYVPYNVGINENAARTLEYAYADFAIAQLATALGKEKDAQRFYKQAKNYQNLFDPHTGLMRGKNEDGTFQSPFNPLKWGDAFTEGNSLHYTWSVFHDMAGLIKLMGGVSPFNQTLDTVFTMPPDFDDSYYGFTIHEIREMQIVNMGNYAHGNQPIQHMPYLYCYAGKPWKTQQKVREIMSKLYAPTPDGYCGDEDNGQTSAWYVMSALGFYPVTPATSQYVIGSPLFDEATLKLQNGNTLKIVAENNGHQTPYIQALKFNGQSYDKAWLDHRSLMKGGEIRFQLAAKPNKKWASEPSAAPFSMTTDMTQ